jgi:AcrR family transcriptional regulator
MVAATSVEASRRSLGFFLVRRPRLPRSARRSGARRLACGTVLDVTEGRTRRTLEAEDRRERIIDAAMRHFAEHGYRGGRVEDIASQVGVAKGTVFLDFGSKEGLFLAAYQRAVAMLPAWLEAPEEVVGDGFWATLDWWLERTEQFNHDDWVPNRLAMIGRYDTGMGLRRPIDRFMRSEDPYGTLEFVEYGVRRGEIRDDIDPEMLASMLDWVAERFQDALSEADLDPGLIHRRPERRGMRIKEFVEILRGGIESGRGEA